ncbi:MAG: calcium-binding protein [Actinomycetota bacterium]
MPSLPRPDVEMQAPISPKTATDAPSSGPVTPNMPALVQSFEGLNRTGSCTGGQCGAGWPPDTVGDVGPSNYIEGVNSAAGIYSKTGTQQAAFTFNSLWSAASTGTACDADHQGDPTVVYDQIADRWFVADFAWGGADLGTGPYYECVAVSKTANPVTGGWWLYAIRADDAIHPYLPDYPKMGIWPDGLYMSANMYDCLNSSCSSATYMGVRAWAFDRTVMEAGGALQGVVFDTDATYFSMLPSNLRGTAPPSGTPNYFVSESSSSTFQVFKFHVDWTTPGSSTFTGPTDVTHASYSTAGGAVVPQPDTAVKLDSLEDRLMMQAQYRNISGTESLWVAHTVGNVPVGIQWAQIDVTGSTVSTTPVQQQIWRNVANDGVSRWMPSLAVDGLGNMAIGYSASSGSVYPSLRYAGRLAADPSNTLGQGEATMMAGAGSQTVYDRWGDYSSMSVDPVDDCTFWYVGEYYSATGTDWHTRIGSFAFPGCASPPPPVCTITGTSGNDLLIGTPGDDVICGLGGKDTLKGRGGNDDLRGGGGNDTVYPGTGDDLVDGGAGTDRVSYSDLKAKVTVNLSRSSTGGAAGSDMLRLIERATGTKYADTLKGNTHANNLIGLAGNDSIFGLKGNDVLDGGTGTDSLDGGPGTDTCKHAERKKSCER